MEELAEVSCAIIAAVGAAKGCFVEAIRYARDLKIDEAEQSYEEGVKDYNIGHKSHSELLAKFAGGEKVECDMLLVHAECQMMSAEDFMVISREVIDAMKERNL